MTTTYACQQYDPARLCRYDRREIDQRCTGCERTTDDAYLVSMGLKPQQAIDRVTAMEVAAK